MAIRFLTLEEVLELHLDMIKEFGGDASVRDLGLLQSAIAMPEASFGGQYLHETLAEKAAAYLYHIAKNHPFVDGNKRTAFTAAIAFIYFNNYEFHVPSEVAERFTWDVAAGLKSKDDVIAFFTSNIVPE